MDKLRVGIIGVGNMGSAHAKNIYEGHIEHMRLAALCDTDAEKRMRCNSFWPDVAVFDNADDLLASGLVDAVIIATPHYYHPPLAIRAFEAGCHVLTEKPAGVSLSAAVHMSEAAEKSGKVFGIMFNQRTDPLFSRAREIVRSGELGQPKRLTWIITNWYRTQHYYDSGDWRATWSGEGGGVLLNQAPHNLDIWQWIFGMPKSVRAVCRVGQYHHIEVEDEATIYARYSDGAFATFITSTGEFPGTNRLEIVGDRAKLVLEGGKLCRWRLERPERSFCFESERSFDKIPMEYDEFVPECKGAGHTGILENFARGVLYGEPLLAPGADGLNELALSNAAYLSSWLDREIRLPPDSELFDAELAARIAESDSGRRSNSDDSGAANAIEKQNPTAEKPSGYSERWHVNW